MGQGVIKPFKFQIPMHGSSKKVVCGLKTVTWSW